MTRLITLVTGASGALGSAVCETLIGRGHRVAALDRSADGLAKLESLGSSCLRIQTDLLDAGDWPRVLDRVEQTFGPWTGAVLVAGGWAGGAPVHEETDESTWRRMLDINLETAQRSLRAVLPELVQRGEGSIVVIGSRAVERPWESGQAAAYAAAKSALVALAQAIAAEVIDQNVRINAVLPSMIDTAANRSAMPDADASRWVSPASIASVIAFLLSDEARDISGAAIPVYGRA